MNDRRKRLTNEQEGRAFFIRHPRSASPLTIGETYTCTGAFDQYNITIEEIFDVYQCDTTHVMYVVSGKRTPYTSEERALSEREDTRNA